MRSALLESITLERYEREFAGRHLVHEVVDYWAARRPTEPALIHHEAGASTDWAEFAAASREVAARLLALGFRRGDRLVTALTFSKAHVLLEYACFRLGVIVVPLDLRLRPAEFAAAIAAVEARGFASLPELSAAMRQACPFLEQVFSFAPGAQVLEVINNAPAPEAEFAAATAAVSPHDAALAIFTTGSTGSPKPALLSHRNITTQNLALGGAFRFGEGMRVLVNLPPSHVGGQSEAMMTALYFGGTAVILDIFDPGRSLDAIAKHRVQVIGQIPAMFHFEWRHPAYATTDLSSLELNIYGGQAFAPAALEKAATMAPALVTGLGLTECAGFCTYTLPEWGAAELAGNLGYDLPLYPLSIRANMREDGSAGEELPAGEIGNVCFRGPQTFLGYYNNPEATARTISTDGYLYTGDLGSLGERGLRLAGRTKWVIKPTGYQVFPGDVEAHLCAHPAVANCGVVGAEHRSLSEAVVAFVEVKSDTQVSAQELRRHAREMASYMRPLHYVLVKQGELPPELCTPPKLARGG